MNTFKSLILVTIALSAVILSVSLNSLGHALAQAVQEERVSAGSTAPDFLNDGHPEFLQTDGPSSSPVPPFKVGSRFRATLQSGSTIQCKLQDIKGAWLKCEIPASGIPSDTATIWLNSYNVLTVDTPPSN